MATAIGPQSPNFTTTRPATDSDVSGGVDSWFKDCSAAGANDGTVVTASWYNVITAQLREAIDTAGITLDNSDDQMLYKAIQAIAAVGYTASTGVKLSGSDIQLTFGDGSLASLASGALDTLNDKLLVWDASAGAHVETTPYLILKDIMSGSTGVTFNDATGQISFTSNSFTAASTPPAGPIVGDRWFDTDDDILYERINDGVQDLWVQI